MNYKSNLIFKNPHFYLENENNKKALLIKKRALEVLLYFVIQ